MFVFGNLFWTLADLINVIVNIYIWIIILRVVISWVDANPYNALVQFVIKITEPVLKPVRRILPPWRLNGLDVSPAIVIILLYIVNRFVYLTLYDLGNHLR